MTGHVQTIFGSDLGGGGGEGGEEGKEQHLTCEPGGGREGGGGVGSDGVRAHLSAEPNNTMATGAERRDERNDSQREGHPGGGGGRLEGG